MARLELDVEQVTNDPVLGTPVVILRERGGGRCIPLWVGRSEARSILSELRQVPMARPTTHDLMREMIFRLRATVRCVTVTDLVEGTFFAVVTLDTPAGEVDLDARPSDAIALSLRARAPIFADAPVLDRAWTLATLLDLEAPPLGGGPQPLVTAPGAGGCTDVLESLPEADFGKWKM